MGGRRGARSAPLHHHQSIKKEDEGGFFSGRMRNLGFKDGFEDGLFGNDGNEDLYWISKMILKTGKFE